MKHIALLLAASLTISFTIPEITLSGSRLTNAPASFQNDRDFLLNYYQTTADNLRKGITGLNTGQMRYKPISEQWSVSQCIEHIILTEKMLFELTKESLQKPANPERKKEVKITGQQLIEGIVDRSFKAEAPESLQPEDKYIDPATAMHAFLTQRTEILHFINNADIDDLRDHISDSPFGPVDAYHSLLFIAGHTARHTLQIEEVKESPGFPTE